ncbi:MAG: ABC transporter ATP-binding protein [Planctomycetota bacterium]
MISVRHLTKRFIDIVAVDDASFDVEPGEVMGFLGPNGAGKTTTLRILTGYLPATRGTARVAGLDVLEDAVEVRARVGYLPENVPLYLEMRVQEYLVFRARLKGLTRRAARDRLQEVLVECGLADMRRRIVGQLSKGYRQRVGLADALLASPPVLILDEPTAGLDPGQRKEVRQLIQRLGRQRTVLLSSHILGEVEDVCHRVMIIKGGRILAIGAPHELVGKLQGEADLDRIRLETRAAPARVEPLLHSMPSVRSIHSEVLSDGFNAFDVLVEAGSDPREEIVAKLTAEGAGLRELRRVSLSLEEIFLRLTAGSEIEARIPARIAGATGIPRAGGSGQPDLASGAGREKPGEEAR